MRPKTKRNQVKSRLKELLSGGDAPSEMFLAGLDANWRTAKAALEELGGHVYNREGIWFWTLEREGSVLSLVKSRLKRELKRRRQVTRSEMIASCADVASERIVDEAARQLKLKRVKVGRTVRWRL